MSKKKDKLPDFNKMSYKEEASWWDTHDLGDFWSELKDVEVMVDLHRPKEETLVVRLQKNAKDRLVKVAKSKGINTSTLARLWLLEKLYKPV